MGTDIDVQVVYAQAGSVWQARLTLPAGSTVGQAIDASGFARSNPDYPQAVLAVGIYGQTCTLDRQLAPGDRVEIYRPLNFDPMESRRRRAQHRKAFMTKRLSRT
ncbi:RnfH family protein [Pusillimonas sp. MFBS29]|uniref:RnfH family protein n=1 Tax=Pusillimonas sp. MFBS29 TaxID=2886690 RepID=UPI001D12AB47|nr:RnfH family protein [Pusillimonas sp. MFBS29]MCC2595543.1 RnfH family protein [Pusillimonas sp. MFBS29]